MTSASLRADYMVHQRRAKEDYLRDMNTHIAADYKLRHKAQWETTTQNVINRNVVDNRVREIKETRSIQLELRRQRLAALLAEEDEMYRREYIAMQETPEDIRRRMAERLQTLKETRLQERTQDVRFKLEQRWKESADDLRLQDSKLMALQCKLEQEQQMWEKRQKHLQNQQDAAVFDELWRREYIRRGEIEQEKIQAHKELNDERMQYLNWQRDLREREREAVAKLSEEEKLMLREEWDKDKEREAELQGARNNLVLKQNRDILVQNEATIDLKKQEALKEKEFDKFLIQRALEKEQAEEALERQKRLQQREEAKATLIFVSDKSNKDKEFERRIEEAAKAESDKQWEELERKWQQREAARIALLKDVYQSRAEEIRDKKRLLQDEQDRENAERDRIVQDVERGEELDQMRKTAMRLANVEHQEELRFQMEDKDRQRRKEIQDDMYEIRAMKLAELEYKRKLEEEKKKGQALLDELRAKRPF